jgi:hypothetical protein
MSASSDPGSYEVRYGVRSAVSKLAFLSVPTLGAVLATVTWSRSGATLFIALAVWVVVAGALAAEIRKIVQRRSIVVIGSRGVHLGRDDADHPATWEPWEAIDAVVHFNGQYVRAAGNQLTRFVGVVRDGQIVNYRHLGGSRLDLERAAEAVARHGGGTPFWEAPEQRGLKSDTVPLPDDWRLAFTEENQPDRR